MLWSDYKYYTDKEVLISTSRGYVSYVPEVSIGGLSNPGYRYLLPWSDCFGKDCAPASGGPLWNAYI